MRISEPKSEGRPHSEKTRGGTARLSLFRASPSPSLILLASGLVWWSTRERHLSSDAVWAAALVNRESRKHGLVPRLPGFLGQISHDHFSIRRHISTGRGGLQYILPTPAYVPTAGGTHPIIAADQRLPTDLHYRNRYSR